MTQAIWNIASAPLQISVDVKAVPAATKAILLNTEIIAVGQGRTLSGGWASAS